MDWTGRDRGKKVTASEGMGTKGGQSGDKVMRQKTKRKKARKRRNDKTRTWWKTRMNERW